MICVARDAVRGGWKLVISDACNRDDVIIRAAIALWPIVKGELDFIHLGLPPLFGTKVAQWILLGEL